MASLISLIIIFTLSLLITKIASEALVHTGLSKQSARFQARSAYTGVGFTTSESENIVKHPLRRKIIMTLMLVGNVGIISAVASLLLTFMKADGDTIPDYLKIIIILVSIGLLWLFSRSQWLERTLVRVIKKGLEKFTKLNIKDYVELLNLTRDYEITVLHVQENDWIANKKLKELNLRKEGINLIGIRREDGNYIGTPDGNTEIIEDDRLILYGRESILRSLEKRKRNRKGDQEHEKAKAEQQREKHRQEEKERERRAR